ncbi:unnamed protein product [Notodromas monacha]|uniref:Uncharacterized protein n=1 Tax=Notodromas monacha TaxID=399045 RepID=A0A7R9BRG7_9CRUS|nr:unnamed protein product [Notodromas monacha]CAG0918949.1 unnamed protein product [Notodromas monacha]
MEVRAIVHSDSTGKSGAKSEPARSRGGSPKPSSKPLVHASVRRATPLVAVMAAHGIKKNSSCDNLISKPFDEPGRERRYSTSSSSGCGRRNSASSSSNGRRAASAAAVAAAAAAAAAADDNAASVSAGMRKQHSFDSFESKKKSKSRAPAGRSASLKKTDSFEGHEEAVKSIVAAVQETRTLRKKKK